MKSMNEKRFTGKAELYRKYRPSYPVELINYLFTEVGFSIDSIIADIGAGTGILTKLLLDRGSKVFAVEPNVDMRKVSIDDLSEYKNFVSINATAENTGLHDKSVDFVTTATAFHYFDRQLFKRECQRILRPGGKSVIIWNNTDDETDIIRKCNKLIDKYRIDDNSVYERSGNNSEFSDIFVNGMYAQKIFRNDIYENREHFIGGTLSAGFSPNEDDHPEKYYGYVRELNELFDEYSVDDMLTFPHITKSYAGVMVAN